MPRFGHVSAADVWAAGTRTLTDLSAEEIFDLPALDAFAPSGQGYVESAAPADQFGAWVELVADVGAGKRLIELSVRPDSSTAAEIEIGEGASGSEVAIARSQAMTQAGHTQRIQFWKSLTDNARLAARARDAEATAKAYYMMLVIG